MGPGQGGADADPDLDVEGPVDADRVPDVEAPGGEAPVMALVPGEDGAPVSDLDARAAGWGDWWARVAGWDALPAARA